MDQVEIQPATRWTRRKQARPTEILDAALSVFAEKGYAGTRMDEIAKRAGVTKGTIYLYFESKEAVFKTLVRDSIGATLADVTANVSNFQGSAKDLLRFALNAMGHLLTTSDRVVLPKIIIAESGNFPELAHFYREEIIDKGLALMSSLIERGIAQGEFRKVPVQHAVRLCIAPVLLGAIWRVTFGQFDSEPYDYAGLIETHLDVLFRGLSAKGDVS
ncbi:MAG TPA: TetR/AcrR family transcriptional regulator [Rhizomicrobium sp.]|nr:TetR/AcrR family transcriptional regulator [Rhizomicrobium sp.]